MSDASAQAAAGARGMKSLTRISVVNLRELALLPALIVALVIGAVTSDGFLTSQNLLIILQQSSGWRSSRSRSA